MGDVLTRLDTGGPWWVVALAALPSFASAVWVIWKWWGDRDQRRADASSTREERQGRAVDAQRDALSREQTAMFDRLRLELDRERARCDEVERDRDRGWNLARLWHRRAHELRHHGLSAQARASELIARDPAMTAPVWPDMSVQGFEEPIPRG